MRSKKDMEKAPLTREEELEEQVSNLKKALEYSELRNQGLMKVIEIKLTVDITQALCTEFNLLSRLLPTNIENCSYLRQLG